MRANMMPAFPAWQPHAANLPPPTRLYHLAPIGVGTMQTESLTSYIARLADAHCVRVSTLVHREIGPGVLDHGAVRSLAQQNWTHYSHAINGTEATAQVLVDALQVLTGRLDLCFLTMLTWSPVVPPLGLLRRERAWCPTCYHEWREQGRPVYDPLLWALAAVTGCPLHGHDLWQRCPVCQKAQPPLAVAARPGHCARCGAWLGVARTHQPPISPWASWVAAAVGGLIAATPAVRPRPTKEQLIDAIEHCSAAPPGERRQDVAHAAHVSHSHLWAWRRGHTAPTLPLLLRLCGSLGMTPLQLLAPGTAIVDRSLPLSTPTDLPAKKPRGPRNGDDHATIRRHVAALVCQDLHPPPPLRQVAQAVGHTEGTLRRVCPDLSACLVARWRTHRHEQKLAHDQAIAVAVRQVMLQIHAHGLPLTTKRIRALLPYRGCLRTAVARQAWQDTLRELDQDTEAGCYAT